MTETKVQRIAVSWKQRWRNRMGNQAVQCQVSNRWLQFPEGAGTGTDGEDWMIVDVMTLDSNEQPKKICELVLSRADILQTLEHVAKPARR